MIQGTVPHFVTQHYFEHGLQLFDDYFTKH